MALKCQSLCTFKDQSYVTSVQNLISSVTRQFHIAAQFNAGELKKKAPEYKQCETEVKCGIRIPYVIAYWKLFETLNNTF